MDIENEKRRILEKSAEENLGLYEKFRHLRKKGLDGMPPEFLNEQKELIRKTLRKLEALKEKNNEQDR